MRHIIVVYAKIWTILSLLALTAGPALMAGYAIGGGDVGDLFTGFSPTERFWAVVFFGCSTGVAILGALWNLANAVDG